MDFFVGPFLTDFGQNWSKIASAGPGRVLKSFLDALGSILVKYQPKRRGPISAHLLYVSLSLLTTIFVETNSF